MRSLIVLITLLLSCTSAAAQSAPPIGGFTGTYVPDATVKTEYEGAHGIAEGVGHVVGYAKKLFGIKGAVAFGLHDPGRLKTGEIEELAVEKMRQLDVA